MSGKAKVVSIPRNIVEKYIEGYYEDDYHIDESIQPNFWEAVYLLCENPNTDVSHLIDTSEAAEFCVNWRGNGNEHVITVDNEAYDVIQLAENTASEIRENETSDINLVRADIFLMKKKMEEWEQKLKKISLIF